MSLLSEENCDVHLHAEIEVLKKALAEKQIQLIAMETACLHESDRQVELEDSIIAWQDKYDRLYESHKRVQKVNQNLEDKLLKLVDRNAGERAQLTSDVATLSVRLAQANYNIANLQREIERYKNDMSLAIQLLQCKPDSFVPQKISSLPVEIQTKVASYMRLDTNSHSDSEGSTSGVGVATSNSYRVLPASDSPPPICPFPPTAMVYSMRGIDAPENFNNNNNVSNNCTNTTNTNNINEISSSVMAKFLEDELKASDIKHCDTCQCSNKDLTVLTDTPKFYSIATQTLMQGDTNNSLCLRCNSNLNSPSRANSPYIMKLVKSSDSVISETKSSVSDSTQNEKLFTPAKKDDLMVNPILSHHRLCDRTPKPIVPIDIIGSNSNINNIVNNNNVTDVKLDDELINLIEEQIIVVQPQQQQHQQPILQVHTIPQVLVQEPHQAIITVPPTITNNINSLVDIQPSDLLSNNNNINNNNNNNSCEIKHESVTTANDEVVEYAEIKKSHNLSSVNETGAASQQCTTNGSTSSLWSKTSSNIGTEGAKMFESFNRNLIKTIKSDNPKVSGPRLCALRIQNGSNNILLDGVDPNMAPVVYTKRSRFLDEELDDTKDIITTTGRACDTHISMVMGGNGINSNDVTIEDVGDNKTDSEKCREAHSKENSIILNDSINTNPASTLVKNENSISVSNISIITSDKMITSPQSNSTNNINKDLNNKRSDRKEFETNSSCKSKNTKSGTQSSSISSDVDIQESVLLRRQQLTRVAEWVQNNSKLDNMGQISNNSSMEALSIDSGYKTKTNNNNNNNHNDQLLGTDKLNAITNNNNINAQMKNSNTNFINNSKINLLTYNHLSNYNNNNNIKLLSTANNDDNKTLVYNYNNNDNIAQNNINMKCINKQQLMQQLQHNNHHYQHQQQQIQLPQQQYLECNDGNLNNNRNNAIGIDIDNNNINNEDIIGGIIINSVSHNNTNNNSSNYVVIDDKHYQQQQQQHVQLNTNKSHVDLAQMEYNVKQFLLKQNEWSIHNKGTMSSNALSTTTTMTTTTTNINSSNNMNTVSSTPYIMGNVGIFGTTAQTVITSAPIAKKHPHRTETNL